MIKAVIFDFDGTLVNTFPVIFDVFQTLFKHYKGILPNKDDIVSMLGPTEIGIINEQFSEHKNRDEIIEAYYNYYEEKHDDLTPCVKEVESLLNVLKKSGIRLGLYTGKGERSLMISLNKIFSNHLFDVIITGDDVVYPKPDPEGIEKALNLLKFKSNECIYVGDSDADMIAGKKAGLITFRADWFDLGFKHPKDVTGDFEFTSLQDFKTHLMEVIDVS